METQLIVGIVLAALIVAAISYGIYRASITKKLDEAAEEARQIILADEAAARETALKVSAAIKTVAKKRSHHKKQVK